MSSTRPAPEPPAPTTPTRCHGPSPALAPAAVDRPGLHTVFHGPAPAHPATAGPAGTRTATPTPASLTPGSTAAIRTVATEPSGTAHPRHPAAPTPATPTPAAPTPAAPAPGSTVAAGRPAGTRTATPTPAVLTPGSTAAVRTGATEPSGTAHPRHPAAPTPATPTPAAPAPGSTVAAGRPAGDAQPSRPAAEGPAGATAAASHALASAGSGGVPAAPGAGAYRRLGEVVPQVRVRCAPPRSGRGWIAGAELVADPAALRELVAYEARQGLARYGRALRPDVAAGIGLHRFVWAASLLFTLPWFLERRVPLLTPADVSVRRRSGELTVRPGAFVHLPGDPSAGAAPAGAARAVPDETVLTAELRAALAGFLAPVLAAFRPEVRRGPRVLWAMATDAVVEGLWHVGGLLGEEERARTELTALFTADGPGAPECAPFTPGAGFTAPASDAAPHTERPERCRASCCLVYTARVEAMCAGCPRLTRG
ncbi:(2Fe-2S)-binding protein [Kitasatospora sp. NPDC008115]|uniref:(2Fe-2S)-binding protein n=1 Tax=Kitasatospora sp. NPDC008115 TaxID=3364022 RepID=UPI0036E2488C